MWTPTFRLLGYIRAFWQWLWYSWIWFSRNHFSTTSKCSNTWWVDFGGGGGCCDQGLSVLRNLFGYLCGFRVANVNFFAKFSETFFGILIYMHKIAYYNTCFWFLDCLDGHLRRFGFRCAWAWGQSWSSILLRLPLSLLLLPILQKLLWIQTLLLLLKWQHLTTTKLFISCQSVRHIVETYNSRLCKILYNILKNIVL